LFNKQNESFLNEANQKLLFEVTSKFSRAKKSNGIGPSNWLSEQYQLDHNYLNSASLMVAGEGLKGELSKQGKFWLRADPVMLSPTHNGILCRGNRVLELSPEERLSIEKLVNGYLNERSMKLTFSNSRQAYLNASDAIDCEFTALDKVMGQDITHRLPKGEKHKFWHAMLTDLQMLLHNCEVNRQREVKQLPTVSGLWLWAESQLIPLSNEKPNCELYTDDAALAGAAGQLKNLDKLAKKFNQEAINNDSIIHVSEFAETYNQNDMQGWQALFQLWIGDWLLPALVAVDNKQLEELVLVTDDNHSYSYNHFSSWCFWRNHTFGSN